MTEPKTLSISYYFRFNGESEKSFKLLFDAQTMEYLPSSNEVPPEWTLLELCKCKNCPFDSTQVKYCPVAKNMAEVTSHFSIEKSYREASISVETQERTYLKNAPLQTGLFSILGLIMPTSGCPHLEFLKPMARFHMPFSSADETFVRSISFYLLKQYFRLKKGEEPDFHLEAFEKNYQEVGLVNRGIISRIRTMAKGDANQNAIVVLDGFASLLEIERASHYSELEDLLSFKKT